MQQLKAHSLITFLVPFHIIHDGDFRKQGSVKSKYLEIYPQVNSKKARVTLNAFGSVASGAGFDIHCIRFVRVLIKIHHNITDEALVMALAPMMKPESALNFNDNIGELSQQYQKGGERKTWALAVLTKLASCCADFEAMHSMYLTDLEKASKKGKGNI